MISIHGVDIYEPYYPEPLFSMTPRSSPPTDLCVHHTAGPLTQTALDIDQEHRNLTPPDAMIAYNYVITPDGKIYAGRPNSFVGAAAFGRNSQCLSVVLVGNFQSDDAGFTGDPTPAQVKALEALAVALHVQYPTICRTYGHGQIAAMFYGGDSNYATACPGNRLLALLPQIRAVISARLVGRK